MSMRSHLSCSRSRSGILALAPSARRQASPTDVVERHEGGSKASGAGGGTAVDDPDCTVAQESTAGSACVECDPTGASCGALDSSYVKICQSAANKAVYCNGPVREAPSDQNVACSVALPGGAAGGLAGCGVLVIAAAALLMRRR